MCGSKPKTMLTDQDAAMANALASTWPETQHRLCIWHIYQNAATHLGRVMAKFRSFTDDFSSCIYDFKDEDDFLIAWDLMLDKYDLQDNSWLKRLFDLREKWSLVYGHQMFCADMTTTQRSESINMLLKRYVSYKNKILEFFNNFERLIEDQRYAELTADFKMNVSFPSIRHPCLLLQHATRVYTPEVYVWFEGEWNKSLDSICVDNGHIEDVRKYKITPQGKHHHHTVSHDEIQGKFDCSCKKIGFAGILCSHVIKVFSLKNIVKIPEQYILKRWTRQAKAGHFGVSENVGDGTNLDPKVAYRLRYKDLCTLYVQLATKAAETMETYRSAKKHLLDLIETVDASLQAQNINLHSSKANQLGNQIGGTVCEGKTKIIKGIKVKKQITSGKRKKGALEKMVSKKRKPKAQSVGTSMSSQQSSVPREACEVILQAMSSVPVVGHETYEYTEIQVVPDSSDGPVLTPDVRCGCPYPCKSGTICRSWGCFV